MCFHPITIVFFMPVLPVLPVLSVLLLLVQTQTISFRDEIWNTHTGLPAAVTAVTDKTLLSYSHPAAHFRLFIRLMIRSRQCCVRLLLSTPTPHVLLHDHLLLHVLLHLNLVLHLRLCLPLRHHGVFASQD